MAHGGMNEFHDGPTRQSGRLKLLTLDAMKDRDEKSRDDIFALLRIVNRSLVYQRFWSERVLRENQGR